MTLALDGTDKVSGNATSLSTPGLTTTQAGDVIVAVIVARNASSTPSVTSISTPGVTWNSAPRLRTSFSNFIQTDFEIWQGIAASPLSAASTTVNMSASSNPFYVMIFAVSGADANASAINDNNSSFPAQGSGSNSVPTIAALSTDNANDFGWSMCLSGDQSMSDGPGYSPIISNFGSGIYASLQYRISTTIQTNSTFLFGANPGNNWQMIADAIQSAPPVIPPSPRRIAYRRH